MNKIKWILIIKMIAVLFHLQIFKICAILFKYLNKHY
jgi:hypothetical protein